MKRLMTAVAAGTALNTLAGAVPVVSEATMTQHPNSREVTITYTLADAPAIVTLDVQTNATDGTWASIGGENVQHVTGDVWQRIETGARTILWRPDLSWPNHKIAEGGARAVVTAWSLDNPPDYMVVDITPNAVANSERYYPAAEFLPGGILGNVDYRQSLIVLRKIAAKDVTWTMGSAPTEWKRMADETAHNVTLTDNYYIGVFPVTQAQWAFVQTARPMPSRFSVQCEMRPVESVCYNEIRNAANSQTADTSCDWPNKPNPNSFLGLLRTKTGLPFDLPSEAQWEFACRAGQGSGVWNDGSAIQQVSKDANLDRLARYKFNGGYRAVTNESGEVTYPDPSPWSSIAEWGPENGTAIVGSYAPNGWGLYDMLGNTWEWCLDWYAADITGLQGAVNENAASGKRVTRSCTWSYIVEYQRPACRNISFAPTTRSESIGFRLALNVSALPAE